MRQSSLQGTGANFAGLKGEGATSQGIQAPLEMRANLSRQPE